MNAPLLRQIEELPFSASLGASVVVAVHALPPFIFLRRIPDNLGIRPYQQIFSPSLQLFSSGAV